jgi:hypothetical protein
MTRGLRCQDYCHVMFPVMTIKIYKIQVAVFGEQHLSLYIKSGRSEEWILLWPVGTNIHIRAEKQQTFSHVLVLTTRENNKLYDLALKFNKPKGLREIKYFYRNKKRQYFDDIMNDMDGAWQHANRPFYIISKKDCCKCQVDVGIYCRTYYDKRT